MKAVLIGYDTKFGAVNVTRETPLGTEFEIDLSQILTWRMRNDRDRITVDVPMVMIISPESEKGWFPKELLLIEGETNESNAH